MNVPNVPVEFQTAVAPDVGVAVVLLAVVALCWLLFRPRGLPALATL